MKGLRFRKKAFSLILGHYDSFLLIGISLWLSAKSYNIGYHYQAIFLLVSALIKLVGIIRANIAMRVIGLMALNSFWAVNVYMFLTNQFLPIQLPYQFPLFILLVGLGIALRGRLDGS